MSRGTQTSKFGLRDLGLFVPDEVGVVGGPGFGRDKTADALPEQTLKPKFDPRAKVTRHFPGRAPKWLQKQDLDDDDDDDDDRDHHSSEESGKAVARRRSGGSSCSSSSSSSSSTARRPNAAANSVHTSASAAAAVQSPAGGGPSSQRRRRFQAEEVEEDAAQPLSGPFGKSNANGDDGDDDDDGGATARARARARARRRAAALAVDEDGTALGSNDAEQRVAGDVEVQGVKQAETEEDIMARRARIRSRLRAREKVVAQEVDDGEGQDDEDEELPIADSENESGEDEEEEEESSSGSWETDSSDEDGPGGPGSFPLKKPTFVPKSQRATIKAREAKEARQEAKYAAEALKLEHRAVATRQLVVDEIQAEQDAEEAGDEDGGEMPDDTDDPNDLEEYEAWKVRELKRLQRDRDARRKVELERAEVERRRGLTDAERAKEDAELIAAGLKKDPNAKKSKLKFMQKYYHKGVFYMDDDSITDKNDVRRKDYNEPTLEDHFNKQELPKVLQVKNFGKIGRTKYTHLADQDTTDFDNPFLQKTRVRDQMMKRRAGQHGNLDEAGRLKRSRKSRKSGSKQ